MVAAMCFSLAACGGDKEPSGNNSETQQEQNNEENNKIEVVELTADNWQNYLEIETVFRAETNAFNDIDNLWVNYALVLKDEYVSKFSGADGAFEFSFSEQTLRPIEYNVSTKEFTLGTAYTQEEIKSMHIGFDASETDTRIVYFGGYGEYGFETDEWHGCYPDSFQAGEDVVTGDTSIFGNVEITRIQGNLYFKK